MSKHQGRRIDRHTAEQLLRGAPADAPDALAGLLAAAAAPPRDGELGGEPAAMTAFLEAQHAPAPRPRSPSMIKTMVAKLLTAKVAAAAAAVFAVGGVATAAATGALPLPAGGSSPAPSASTHAQQPADSATDATKSAAPSEARPTDRPSPSPSLVGLCHAYGAGDKAEHGKALESPAFTALITAAGDKTKVDGYCDALIKDEAAKPTHPTGAPADPGNSESGKNHAPETGAHPTGAPETHPSGPPAGRPTR